MSKRRELHIYADNPMLYLTMEMDLEKIKNILFTYADTAEAIIDCRDKVYTSQIVFLSHTWIKAGYDIYLYDRGMTILFGDEYLDMINARNNPAIPHSYMFSLYCIGDLYEDNSY